MMAEKNCDRKARKRGSMIYCIADASYPLEYVSCGNLISEDGFVHPKRNIDSFVLILVVEGTLHIAQGNNNYDVKGNEFILLLSNTLHYGYKPSKGFLSYYWVHFYIRDPNYVLYTRGSLLRHETVLKTGADHTSTSHLENFMIPEWGKLAVYKRSHLLFVQLLDIAKRENYSATWRCHYALSLLVFEVMNESFQSGSFLQSDMPVKILDIIEWLRTHYDRPLTVAYIAERFNYHPTYLTALFKKYTGQSLLNYLNQTRISVAKNLLTSRDLSIYFIASTCGFRDEKYFMKLFKKYEGMTPTQYRKAFHQKKINTN